MIHKTRTIILKHCEIDIGPQYVVTRFSDGTGYGAFPHETPEYYALAKRCGYRGSIWNYCIEHEIAHSLVAEELFNSPSYVLWRLAHKLKANQTADILLEEELSISLQAFARAKILPGSSSPGWDWFKVRDRFLEVCNNVPRT